MNALHLHQVLEHDGEVTVKGLPFQKGDEVDVIFVLDDRAPSRKGTLTASALRRSSLVGMWRGRRDIGDSSTFARRLRGEIQKRRR